MDLNRIYAPDELEEKAFEILWQFDKLYDARKEGKFPHVIHGKKDDYGDYSHIRSLRLNGLTVYSTDYLTPKANVKSGCKQRIIRAEAPPRHAFNFLNCDLSYSVLMDQLENDRRFETLSIDNLTRYAAYMMPEEGRDYGYTIEAKRTFRPGQFPWNGFKSYLDSRAVNVGDQDTPKLRTAIVTVMEEIIDRIRNNQNFNGILSRIS